MAAEGAQVPARMALVGVVALLSVGAVARPASAGVELTTGAHAPPQTLFDDFTYARRADLARHGWIVRTEAGWPGVVGAHWSAANVTFVADVGRRGNRLLRMSSWTDGTPAGTSQAQVCHARKYVEGTYATRVRFHDAPSRGLDVDQLVETFYAISPLVAPLDPNYSELDWEYLPNGGWGLAPPTVYVTSWETVRLEPWLADNTYATATGSLDGWHTLVTQVVGGRISYYLDRALLATHGDRFSPEVPMSINYNLWFIDGGLLAGGTVRRYDEDVDWVFHQAGTALSPSEVVARVAKLRRARVAFRDSVRPASPPLASPCNF
jgi:hypothetical protein